MKQEIKFSEKELEKIKSFQQQYMDVQMNFGQSEIIRLRLNRQLEELDAHYITVENSFKEIQQKERVFIDKINEKYGDGVLDPDTGVFTPNISTK